MTQLNLAAAVHHYFLEHLPRHKGLQSSTIRSYRDSLRLFLIFVADANRKAGLPPQHRPRTIRP